MLKRALASECLARWAGSGVWAIEREQQEKEDWPLINTNFSQLHVLAFTA